MEHKLTQQQMEAVNELAKTNIKISEAKESLLKLKNIEKDYILERESKTIERIDAILKESKNLLDQTKHNYEEVHVFYLTVASFADFLAEIVSEFEKTIENFNKMSEEWDKDARAQEKVLADLKNDLNIQKKILEKDKLSIGSAYKKLDKEKIRISSRQEQIKVALEVLKNKQNNG